MIIAIDGYSSTGKSSISKQIAKILNIVHLDTGALYRTVAYFALQNNLVNEDFEGLEAHLPDININLEVDGHEAKVWLNGQDVSQEIRQAQVSALVSALAAKAYVRNFLTLTQRQLGEQHSLIVDGRDIGTVIFPEADFKFFLTASIDARSQRRYQEMQASGLESTLESVKENLMARDFADENREIAPLKQADDAILIDNTLLNKQESIDKILSIIRAKSQRL
jgi:CMP/dCMP kinase